MSALVFGLKLKNFLFENFLTLLDLNKTITKKTNKNKRNIAKSLNLSKGNLISLKGLSFKIVVIVVSRTEDIKTYEESVLKIDACNESGKLIKAYRGGITTLPVSQKVI